MAESKTGVVVENEGSDTAKEAKAALKPFRIEYVSKSGNTVELNED